LGRTSFRGRPAVLDRLRQAAEAGRLGQPFLLVGPEGSGKENTALEFARRLNCVDPSACGSPALCESCVKVLSFQHPDIRWIGPAPASLTEDGVRALVEQKISNPFYQDPAAATAQVRIGDAENPEPMTIRWLIRFLRRRAYQGAYKVAVIADAHRLNTAAANAFLKTLEEPPPDTVIFLLTTGTEGMLPTILSRCQKIRFDPWAEDELAGLLMDIGGAGRDEALRTARLADGNARRGLALLGEEAKAVIAWAGRLFGWIHDRDRARAGIAADELHAGRMSHACLPEGAGAKAFEAKEPALRRDRCIQLCELLNLFYSDTVNCRELGDAWRPRLMGYRDLVGAIAPLRRTETLLVDIAAIEATRQEIDSNINIGLAMAVLFEGLIEHVGNDQNTGAARAGSS
jgi:DNA polymerase III delta prime subunit